MTEVLERYHRNTLLFGAEGQRKLGRTNVAVIGAGGLGSPLIQHLALLGVKRITSVDPEEIDESNRNRSIGTRYTDPVPGSSKVDIVSRMVREINPGVEAIGLKCGLISENAFAAVRGSDWVLGCFDEDGPRAILNELCQAYKKQYIDLASDVPMPGIYGGRVCVSINGNGCLDCLDLLDRNAVRRYIESSERLIHEDKIYGISKTVLEEKGPSVSPVNGVVAALAATEFMVAVTGLRAPTRLLEYRGWESKVVTIVDEPRSECILCKGIRGKPEEADVERYLKLQHLRQD
ncbi:ThiF family adenylyltransferase [uncultured Sneathiella sp.]|uniref:HesA/MoeB/ThiF family protein n=1 Tax=uncultured Sneathiella sp. TaxID=879315 RepID=UPI0025931DC8|nr:ThiF family adenylyltransferase [uncultured Sneathiella sp.]